MEHNRSSQHKSVYDVMTEQIIKLLEQGTVPWKQNWAVKGLPQSLISKIPYRGINMLLLASLGFEQNYFLTRRQLEEVGGKLKEGERPIPVVFWKFPEVKEGEEEQASTEGRKKPFLRYYAVYNVSQCDGIPEKLIPVLKKRNSKPLQICAAIVKGMPNPPSILRSEEVGYYSPKTDVICMPDMKWFNDCSSYYAVLFRELIHSTGHPSRLDRKEGMRGLPFGGEPYSQEELVAEIGACFLEAHAGIETVQIRQNAAHIREEWLTRLKNDSKVLIYASSQAQKAADYILGEKKETVHDMPLQKTVADGKGNQL